MGKALLVFAVIVFLFLCFVAGEAEQQHLENPVALEDALEEAIALEGELTTSGVGGIDVVLVWRTDFSDLKMGPYDNLVKLDGSPLPLTSSFNITNDTTSNVEIINDATAMGGKALLMEMDAAQPTHDRIQFNLFPNDLELVDDIRYTVRMKLPATYTVTTPHDFPTWDGWHELSVLSEWMDEHPTDYLWLRFGVGEGNVDYTAREATPTTTVWSETYSGYPFPLGEWFDLSVTIYRHATAGSVLVRVDDEAVFQVTDVKTKIFDTYHIEPAKLYGGEVVPKRLWVDFVEIYFETENPPPPIPPPPAQYYDVDVLSAVGGSTMPAAGSYQNHVGQLFTATAYSFEDYEFTNWLLFGAEYATNTAITIDGTEGTTYILQPTFTALPGEPEEPAPEPPPPVEPPPEEESPSDPTPPPESPQLPPVALPLGDPTLFSQVLTRLLQQQPPAVADVYALLQRTKPVSFNDVISILEKTKVNA